MTETRNRPLKIGVTLPDGERGMDGKTAAWSELVDMAQTAEGLGYDSIWITDHLLFRHPGKEQRGMWDAWALLSGLAAVTKRVEIGPLVTCTSYRNPAMLAKLASTVDDMSGGRLILGLGAGWHEPEYKAFGHPFDHRVSRFDESLQIIHGLLRNGHVDFQGTYLSALDCELLPRGPRPAGIPIMIGSKGERMLGLLAKYGDQWNAWGRNSVADVIADRELVDAAMIANGRDPKTVERTMSTLVDLRGSMETESGKTPPVSGTPEQMAETFRAFAREGISHVQVVLGPQTKGSIEEFAKVLDILDRG